MNIKINFAVTAFLIGCILLAIGLVMVAVTGMNSVSLVDMFTQNAWVTSFGTILVVAGIALNAFASRK